MSSTPLKQAAQQLEGVMLRQLLRESGVGRVEGTGSHVVTDFFVDALADAVERNGGLGLASLIERSLDPASSISGGAVPAGLRAGAAPMPLEQTHPLALPVHGAAPSILGARAGARLDLHAPERSPVSALAPPHAEAQAHAHTPEQTHTPGEHDAGLLEQLVVSARARTSSAYGMRTDPLTGASKFHHGLDVAAPAGSPIQAVRGGEVVFAGESGGYGLMVEIDHGDGLRTRYAHAQKLHVQEGQRVGEGEHIADVGSTGRSTGSHLHFEARRHGISADPELLLQNSRDRDEGS